MNCLASGNFINYSFISLFVDSFSGSIIMSCLASGNFINYRINDDFFNGNLVSLFVNTFRGLMYSLNRWIDDKFLATSGKQFDIRLLEFFGFQRLTIDSIVDFGFGFR